MTKLFLKQKITLVLFFFPITLFAIDIAGGHRGGITALIHKGEEAISAGEDGFIVIWDIAKKTAVKRFQLTTHRIQEMVSHPVKNEICIIETSSLGGSRISVWNYLSNEKLFSIHSIEPVTYINYSGNGNFIMAAGFGGSPLSLISSETGEIISAPEIPKGLITFAVTGRAERNMLIYQAESDNSHEGQIIYLDLDTGSVISNFEAPPFPNPIIFGNNRFLAGINSNTLQIVNAASGEIFDSIENIGRDALLYPSGDEFFCLSRRGETTLFRFSIDRNGRLVKHQEIPLSSVNGSVSLFAANGSIVFASMQGGLILLEQQNKTVPFEYSFQTRITDIAIGQKNIALLAENGDLCFLPLDFSLLKDSENLEPVQISGYSRLTFLSASDDDDQFILWQTGNTRNAPQIISASQPANRQAANFLQGRFPLRSVSSAANQLLVLDAAGMISVYNTSDIPGRAAFTFTSAGAIDAALVNNETLVLCRSRINNANPFLFINSRTGETVPVPYSIQSGLSVYAVKSGNIYAEAVERDGNRFKTIVLDLTAASSPVKIYDYHEEAAAFSLAESSGALAIACGSEGAFFLKDEPVYFERTNGLPVKLLGSDDYFLCLDSEGSVSFHDNRNGKLLAVFSLHSDRWELAGNKKISGGFSRP
ncbi:MAG: hypothetical protein LBI12_05945 [Treponema sp.]|jgi:WD40 repeat protein|nr:hypothetical protein [Treponema sp.]